jgi:P2 family phage contractile tail tube protein
MSKIAIQNVPNANVYVDGANWLGRCAEIRMPVIKPKMGEYKGLGMVGEIPITTGGIEKLEAEFTFTSVDTIVARKVANPYVACQVQVRASIERHTGAGLTERVPMVTTMYGVWGDNDLGTFKQHEGVQPKAKLYPTLVKQVIDGETVLEYDAISNLFIVNGEDLLAVVRRHLGA